MSLFNWFSGKSTPPAVASDKSGAPLVPGKPTAGPSDRSAAGPGNQGEGRRLKRHARREQLYHAIRESFTHAGVLSATYRFKVLSLDQYGGEFLVMVDVEQSFDHRAERLADIAAKIVHTARTHHEIGVTSVYWRVALSAASPADKTAAPRVTRPAPLQSHDTPGPPPKKAPNFRYDPIQDDEVAAFKQALAAASANSPQPTDTSGKARSNPRSYALLTGFEDTEMPESASAPALSATQYGDLN
ncbi:MAG: hypothetical protein EAZ34_02300 [Polaromonas sp.]|nr:MAG: hypothetical protein EAZ34_02300 [Polaromonas sp.]